MIEKTSDLPNSVKKAIPSNSGRNTFLEAFNYAKGTLHHDDAVAYAIAWAEMDHQGYRETVNGQYVHKDNKRANFLKKEKGVFAFVEPDQATKRQLVEWMQEVGIPNPVHADELHVTTVYSKLPFAGYEPLQTISTANPRQQVWAEDATMPNFSLRLLGKKHNVLVLAFHCPDLEKQHWIACDMGASWDWDYYIPHITLSKNIGDFEFKDVPLPEFQLVFEPERVEDLDDEESGEQGFRFPNQKIFKIDEEKRLAFAWASVIEEDGQTVIDHHGDMIEVDELTQAAHKFMTDSRESKEMHARPKVATVVESMVFTKELQEALGIDLKKVGWFTVIKVHDDETWGRIKNGTLKMMSIGGFAVKQEVDDV